MSDNPDDWVKALENIPPWLGGVLMAVIISVLRVIYDEEETSIVRIALESMICGALSLTFGSIVAAIGANPGWQIFIGGMLGFMGSHTVRRIAMRAVNQRIDKL